MHSITPPPAREDEEYTLAGAEALLAGTLALMTGVAQAGPGAAHADAMAAKIVVNLDALADHPCLSPPMRQMLAGLLPRWQPAARRALADQPRASERALWLRSPSVLQ